MERWQLDRIKDKVEELKGRLEVRVYSPDDVYRIWYFERDDVALYGKIRTDEDGEHIDKSYATTILEAIGLGARVAVTLSGDRKASKWFGPEQDMAPVEELYRYVMSLG